ncbi:MAG TPA: type II toxin-antitoxin system VapC family toxin [Steroidobacteraceae bacterium]|nr:type II toxin-antitoxin system VapC family toxin [Steroidobacteraceae bacterium]
MIVIDASAALELLLGGPLGERVADRVLRETESLHAPHVIDLEVAQVLRRYVARQDLTTERASEALTDFLALGIERYAHVDLLARIWELRANLTAYDAAYVALAEALDCRLLTSDARLARAQGHGARIELAGP